MKTVRVLHVPLPLSRRGNTLMGVVAELGRCQVADGATVGAVISDNRDAHFDGLDNLVVDYTTYCPREWFTRGERLRDDIAARVGRRRRHTGDLYLPTMSAAAAWQPDLLILYEGQATAATVGAWRRALPDARIVLYMHSPLARSFGRRELVRSLEEADVVVFVSHYNRSRFLERVPELAGKAAVVENGVNQSIFHPLEEPSATRGDTDGCAVHPGAEGGPFELLFVGQVAPHKGPDLMLRALAAAQDLTTVPMRASVVGSSAYDAGDELTAYERSLRDLASRSGLDVEFVPFIAKEELAERYRRTSVVCLPSVFDESFPLVAAEAMACGTALVASSRGGLPEVGGDAARYVDPKDTDGFAAVIAELAEHPDTVNRMGAESWRLAEPRTWEAASRRIAEVAGAG